MQERIAGLQATADKERATVARLAKDKTTTQAELEALQTAIDSAKETLEELTTVLAEKTAVFEDVKKQGGKSARAVDKILKDIAACVRFFSCFAFYNALTSLGCRTTRLSDSLRIASLSTVAASWRSSSFR